jgi:hypothetical protein
MRNFGRFVLASTLAFACSNSNISLGEARYRCDIYIHKQDGAGQDVRGRGTSTDGEDEACKAATSVACQNAGAAGDCVASGAFRQTGKSSEMSRVGFSDWDPVGAVYGATPRTTSTAPVIGSDGAGS